MRMIDAKKEIEDKLFQGAPLSLDTMMCALVAINAFIEERGSASSTTLEIHIPDEEQDVVEKAAAEKLMGELKKGVESGEKFGWIDAEDVRKHLGLSEDW